MSFPYKSIYKRKTSASTNKSIIVKREPTIRVSNRIKIFSMNSADSSQVHIQNLLAEYEQRNTIKRLVLCHGRLHNTHSYIPLYHQTLFLDADSSCEPDIVGCVFNTDFFKSRFPRRYFDEIYDGGGPFGGLGTVSNYQLLFNNLKYILKPGARVFIAHLVWFYCNQLVIPSWKSNSRRKSIVKQIQNMILTDFGSYFSHIELKGFKKASENSYTGMFIGTV